MTLLIKGKYGDVGLSLEKDLVWRPLWALESHFERSSSALIYYAFFLCINQIAELVVL